jgi:hypothetical protein
LLAVMVVAFHPCRKLGARLGVSSRQARAYVAALERAKLIRRVKRCDSSGQTSNGFQFLWHALLTDSVKDTSGGPRNDTSALPRKGSSAEESQIEESQIEESQIEESQIEESQIEESQIEESQIEESHIEENEHRLRLPSRISKKTHGASELPSTDCKPYPRLREALADYMQEPGEERIYPTDRLVVDVVDAAEGTGEQDVIQCLQYFLEERGLRSGTVNGPRHFTWFPTSVGDYFRQKRRRLDAADPVGVGESSFGSLVERQCG